jgi:TonB-dependent receptor
MQKLKKLFLLAIAMLFFQISMAQNGSIKGVVTDSNTGETLVGVSVVIEGSTKGAVADLDGNYELKGLNPGTYKLKFSYISYAPLVLEKVVVVKGETTIANAKMREATVTIKEVTISANKHTDTEMSVITSIKSSNLIVSGISSQQISKSQDKDAAEVVRRIPGVTLVDDRFIIVRGLTERYNTVWINGAFTPSSESDVRAFSFDILPSSIIDNIIVYKTPSPEIPADFSGAFVQIFTKSNADENKVELSYSGGYNTTTTFKDFSRYKGGATDWLGFDDGTRALPSGYPSTAELRDLNDNPTDADKERINAIGQSFSKIWTPETIKAMPNQSLSLTTQKHFNIGKVKIGNVSMITYSTSFDYNKIKRNNFYSFDADNNRKADTAYTFLDNRDKNKVKVGVLTNWAFIFGNNQKIEFRNLFNQNGETRTTVRNGTDFYGGKLIESRELSYQSRTTYTGQLGGDFKYFDDKTKINWLLGYSYANKNQPDIRRMEATKNPDDPAETPYTMGINFNADPKLMGRLYLRNDENIYDASFNIDQLVKISDYSFNIKAGYYFEQKNRKFSSRNIGFAIANLSQFNWALLNQPVDSIFQNKNINYVNGIKIDESTNLSDSYEANNLLHAGFLSFKLPVFEKIMIYTGVRFEQNNQHLKGYQVGTGDTVNVRNDIFDIFPSVNVTYNFNTKSLIRVAYGKTVNRPEFREISPFAFYNFEDKATYYGNDSLKNCYINNLDFRYEYYPTDGETFSVGFFYKSFSDPIEAHLKNYGSGSNYLFVNTQKATSIGAELEVRKSLQSYEILPKVIRDMSIGLNASFIKSKVETNDPTERDSVRQMQGQSPYILNAALYYNNKEAKLDVALQYNVIGPRIAYVGDNDNPHIIEMPRNLLDLTVSKGLGKYVVVKAGIKNLLDAKVLFQQTYKLSGDPDHTGKTIQYNDVETFYSYKTGQIFSLGITVKL